jgi:hypothetical protein
VQNAIEANATKVLIEPAWDFGDFIGNDPPIYKLMIADNGDGMDAGELFNNLSFLARSGRTQDIKENFGIGAKITAFTRSPEGVFYATWKDGKYSGAAFALDKELGKYVIQGWDEESSTGYSQYITWREWIRKPEIINKHGTVVILVGRYTEENIYLPDNEPLPWIQASLNNRYFTIPEQCQIRAWQFKSRDPQRMPRERKTHIEVNGEKVQMGATTNIYGKRYYLDKNARAKGIIAVDNANIYWWLLEDIDKRPEWTTKGKYSGGEIGVVWRGELYNVQSFPGSRDRLIKFGVYAGFSRVYILVEPSDDIVVPLLGRDDLKIEGFKEYPWERWAEQFRAVIPEPLAKYVSAEWEKKKPGLTRHSSKKKELRKFLKLISANRYSPTQDGDILATGEALGGDLPISNRSNGKGPGKHSGGNRFDKYFSHSKDEGTPAKKQPDYSKEPEIKWIVPQEDSDYKDLIGKLVWYDMTNRKVVLNQDYLLCDNIAMWLFGFRNEEISKGNEDLYYRVCQDIARDYIRDKIIETILITERLVKGVLRECWIDEHQRIAFSSESLTVACHNFLQSQSELKRELRKREKALITQQEKVLQVA